jgi:hypothetical protein
MKAILGFAIGALLLSAVPASAQHWHDEHDHWLRHAKHHDDEADREFDRHLQGCFLQPPDVHLISEYYAQRSLPPALQKKYYRANHLPPGWEKRIEPIPALVEGQLTAIPREYRRGIIDGSVVLYEPRSGAVLDSVILFSPK